MIANHAQFITALHEQSLVRLEYYSVPDAGTVDRECAPLDYGPDPSGADTLHRYWVWDDDAPRASNPIGLLPVQIVRLEVLGRVFDPNRFGLGARQWSVPRGPTNELRPAASSVSPPPLARPPGVPAGTLTTH